jgi:hypothetical protein
MSTVALDPAPAAAPGTAGSLRQLAALETRRYARHPLFLIGGVLTVAASLGGAEPTTSTFLLVIVPAAGLGVLGLVAMAGMTRTSRTLSRSAGAPPVPERTQTAALALACLLPFAVGVLWSVWAIWADHQQTTPANGFPFGSVSDGWRAAVLFGEAAMASLGGPLLGLLIGRWSPRRGTAPLAAVLLVAAVIVMQGLFEPLRRVRVVMPWTYFGGPAGVPGDDMRMLQYAGSPQWWVAYVACLCGLAVVAAFWHDPEARGPRLRILGIVLLVATIVTCLLAMTTGLDQTLVNPLPSS